MKHLSHIDLTSGELQNATIQNLSKPPLNPRSGRLYYDVIDKTLKVFSEGKWESCINKVLSVNGETGDIIISPSVLEFNSTSNFPDEGEQGKIYLDISSNLLYRWTGSDYVKISSGIVLGETSDTAYRGDRGKLAYDHSLTPHAPSNAQKNSDITKSEIEAKLVGNITTHSHTVTKSDVGLGNVENKSSSTIRSEITNANVTGALGFTPMDASIKGTSNGVAELDAAGKVPTSQLPSYVDDVLEFASLSAFPSTGESGKIYTATDTNIIYRWGGTGYVEISSTIALGETNNTAYRGDRGKIAYDHSQAAHAPADAQKNSDITKGEIEAKLTGVISTHSHTVTKADVGLGNVDNTSDLNKPISTATQTALNTKLDTTVFDNLEIGGRNLWKNSRTAPEQVVVGQYGHVEFGPQVSAFPIKTGDTVTFGISIADIPTGEVVRVRFDFYRADNTYLQGAYGNEVSDEGRSVATFAVPDLSEFVSVRYRVYPVDWTADYPVKIYNEKLELGNRATDWTPAPEDQVSDWNESNVNSFSFIKNKPTSFPPSFHNHPISDITGLQTALNGKLGTGAQAYDSARLGSYSAASYPRKAENANITGLWNINRSGDGVQLLRFNTERQWHFAQSSSGATSGLSLVSEVDQKDFDIRHISGNVAARFRTNSGLSTVYLVPDGGNVGIGTTPTQRLHVAGNGLFAGDLYLAATAPRSIWLPSTRIRDNHGKSLVFSAEGGGLFYFRPQGDGSATSQTLIQTSGLSTPNITVSGTSTLTGNVTTEGNLTAKVGTFTGLNIGTNKVATESWATGQFKPIGYHPTWAQVTNKPTSFTPSVHNHVIGDITGLQTALNSKQDTLIQGSNITITGSTISAVNTTYGVATTSANGLMSSTDKSKLNGIAAGANNYSLPTASTTVLGGIKVGSRLTISSGVLSANIQSDNNFTNAYKTKLDGIATGANNYSHPSSHSPSIIAQDANNRFVTDAEKSTWNAKSNLTLGTTSATAYRGDRGNIAYNHSQSAHAPSNAQKNSDITKAEIEAKLTGNITTHSHTNAAALSNIESAAGATQSTINSLVNARLFEQIALSLTGYGEDAIAGLSRDVLRSFPYNFKAYELRVEFSLPPFGSSAIVTFYRNNASIGSVSIGSNSYVGATVLSSPVVFTKGNKLDVIVTQVGQTTPGATVKAYLQGIKYQ